MTAERAENYLKSWAFQSRIQQEARSQAKVRNLKTVFGKHRWLEEPCIWAKKGRLIIFPVLCLLAFGDTALKSSFLLAFGAHTKRGFKPFDNDNSCVFFKAFGYLGTPEYCKTRENDKSTLFYPPTCISLPPSPVSRKADFVLTKDTQRL